MTRDPWGCFVNLSCPSILTSHISRSKHIQPGNPHNTMRLGHFLEGLRGEVYTPTNQLLTKPTRLYTNSKFDIDTQNDAIVKAGDYIFQGPSCLVYIYMIMIIRLKPDGLQKNIYDPFHFKKTSIVLGRIFPKGCLVELDYLLRSHGWFFVGDWLRCWCRLHGHGILVFAPRNP